MEEIKLKQATENHKAIDFNDIDEIPQKYRDELAKEIAGTEEINTRYNLHDQTHGYFIVDLGRKPEGDDLVFGINREHKTFVKKFKDLKPGDYSEGVITQRHLCTTL
jgi:hypothetical protein